MILEANNIEKAYMSGEQKIPVLMGVDFKIAAGEFVSIQGESGSGKTTLLNILAGLEKCDSGSISWESKQIDSLSLDELAKRRRSFLGMVFQSYYLVPELNALDNVLLAARIAQNGISERIKNKTLFLLEKVGLLDRQKQMPNTLSGGERQRIAIARALVTEPSLVLADEPTGNLDEHTGNRVMDLLSSLCSELDTALILVTHNKSHAELAKSKIYLERGKACSEK
ncbi:ABC transporter ATP-binding protein [Puniceicoccaceae bacterium K14]|nr:ABC transporter ATP-binding protein [Puniceicoccaceae bacterium K14]